MARLIFSAWPAPSSARFILKCIPLPGTIMVEKFTIADGRAAEGRGKPMIERVEWADRKITGYAEEKKETTLGRNGHFGHERTVDRVSSRGGKGTKDIGPPSSIPSLPPKLSKLSGATCDKTEASKRD